MIKKSILIGTYGVGLLLFLMGCAFKQLTPEEKKSADLMPKSAAIQILKKYNLGESISLQESIICGGSRVVVHSSEITEVVYFKSSRFVILRKRNFLCLTQGSIQNVYTESDAREIASALRALGAKIDEVKVMGFN
jgi:hypothetical protein